MSIVLELQKDLLDDTIKLSACLNKAYTIARKLGVKELVDFIKNEINGYHDSKVMPEHRKFIGVLKVKNVMTSRWQELPIDNKQMEEILKCNHILDSVNSIESTVNRKNETNTFFLPLSYTIAPMLLGKNADFCSQIALFGNASLLEGVLGKVRNLLLEWTLKLEEEGILGENYSFTPEEKEKASATHTTINIMGGNNNVQTSPLESIQLQKKELNN